MEDGLIKKQVVEIMTIKKIIITMFLLSIAITAGCLSKENAASTSSTSTDGPGGSDINNPTLITTPTPMATAEAGTSVTDWKKQLEIDKKDPILGQRISRWITPRGELLIAIDNIPAEFKLYPQTLNVYVTDLYIDKYGRTKGVFDNRGANPVVIKEHGFYFIDAEYFLITGLGSISKIDNNAPTNEAFRIKPHEKKSFTSFESMTGPEDGNPENLKNAAKAIFVSPPSVQEIK